MIRSALNSDATEITALWNTMIRETDVTFTTEPKLRRDIEAIIADPTRGVHVAEHEGAFAGFALLGSFRGGPGYAHTVEHTVYLMADAKGHGLGRALIDVLSDVAVSQNHHVMVGAISGVNTDAIGFHETLGFLRVADMPQVGRKNGVWHDLVLMQKILTPPTDTLEATR